MMMTKRTGLSLRRRTILAAAVSAIGLVGAARAEATVPALVDLQVIDRETGETARVWRHAGRLYVAGRPGARYSLRVTNNSPGRVLVVMSVDGVNILTGETAGYGQRGYVFSPYETYDVNGWRKSDTEVAAFNFTALSNSYAARTGRPTDVGVIGIAAFTERVVAPVAAAPAIAAESRARGASDSVVEVVVTGSRIAPAPAPPPPAARAAPSAQAQRQPEKLGTGHGAREWSAVTTVAFERATNSPQLVLRIEYDSFENLVASGVIPRARPVHARPRPFPSSPDRNGYVPDPR
jgi:hypothetical protein